MKKSKQQILEIIFTIILIALPVSYCVWFSIETDKVVEKCIPNFELQVCEFKQ